MLFEFEQRRLFQFGETQTQQERVETSESPKEKTLGEYAQELGENFKKRAENQWKIMKDAANEEPEACKIHQTFCNDVFTKAMKAVFLPPIRVIDQEIFHRMGAVGFEDAWNMAVQFTADEIIDTGRTLKTVAEKLQRGENLNGDEATQMALIAMAIGSGGMGKGVEKGFKLVRKRFKLSDIEERGRLFGHIKEASNEWGIKPTEKLKALKKSNPEAYTEEVETHTNIFLDAVKDLQEHPLSSKELSPQELNDLRIYGINIMKTLRELGEIQKQDEAFEYLQTLAKIQKSL